MIVIGIGVIFIPLAVLGRISPTNVPLSLLVMLSVMLSVWGSLLWRIHAWWPGAQGVWLALLAHAVLASYLLAVVGLACAGLMFFYGSTSISRIASGMMILILFGLAYAGRFAERFIADRCIRRYLNLSTMSPTLS